MLLPRARKRMAMTTARPRRPLTNQGRSNATVTAVITAVTVALDLPWFVSGLLGLAVVIAILFLARGKSITEGTRYEEDLAKDTVTLPDTVRLVKFKRPVAEVSEESEPAENAEAVQV